MGEREDGRPEERDDGHGRRERNLGVRKLPLRTRTQLPLIERERRPGRRRRDRREPLAHGERPLDLVGEPADGNGAGALDPGRGCRLGHDGQQGERPDPRQVAGAVCLAEGVGLPRLSLERDQRPRLPRRQSEPLGDVALRGGKLHQPVEPAVEKDAKQAAELPVDPAHRAEHRAHPSVEREWIEPVAVRLETVDVVRDSVADGAPVEVDEHRPGLVRICRCRAGRQPVR